MWMSYPYVTGVYLQWDTIWKRRVYNWKSTTLASSGISTMDQKLPTRGRAEGQFTVTFGIRTSHSSLISKGISLFNQSNKIWKKPTEIDVWHEANTKTSLTLTHKTTRCLTFFLEIKQFLGMIYVFLFLLFFQRFFIICAIFRWRVTLGILQKPSFQRPR